MPTKTETADLLDRAADIIAQGWTQGALRRGDCYCLDGAIAQASGYPVPKRPNHPDYEALDAQDKVYMHLIVDPACNAALNALAAAIDQRTRTYFGDSPRSICYGFNDKDGRTQDEVISLCRTVAQELRT